ncbi:MAG: type IX secretion system membrane protein PorP/SprF [Dysgonamonadaceae bacterium]|nr:type IX secretion system membrane protein PorP/SprF [Dysgonamonadaceae bacterium]
MKKIVFILFVFPAASCHLLMSQFDSQVSSYWATPNYFNPGYAGQSGKLELTGLYRLQWLGVEHAPKTGIILGEMPVKFFGREHGIGVSMYNDQIGLFKTNLISGQYAYKIKLFGGSLSIGIQGGYISESFDGTRVKIPEDDEQYDPNDEAIPLTEVSGNSIDGAFGLYYAAKNWYAGLSVTHLTSPQLELSENYILEIPRSYYFTAGYNIQLNNPLLELRPSVLLKTMELSTIRIEKDSLIVQTKQSVVKGMLKQTQVDVSLRMVYNKMFWGGLSWRKGDAVQIMIGGKFKMLEVGYVYDFPISDIIRETSGSHELFIKYSVDMNLKKGKKNKHKSVRIL